MAITSTGSPIKEESSKVVIDTFDFNNMCLQATKRVIKNKEQERQMTDRIFNKSPKLKKRNKSIPQQ